MNPSVAVVILNWNGKSWLEQFLPSVCASTYDNLQIIVGDNASTDDSVQFVQQEYPNVEIIVNDQNYGFAGGYNKVLQQVKADYFVLLNSDVEVTSDWIQPVITLMESDEKIAVAQPVIRAFSAKDYFEYAGAAGGYLDKFGYPFCRGRIFDTLEKDSGQYTTSTELFWASGAAFFIKSKLWELAGGLDEALFAHMEEIDLCWRLKNLGYKIACSDTSVVYHVGGGTLDAGSPHKTYLNFRNNLWIIQKNVPKSEATRLLIIRFFLDFIAWIKFLLSGKFAFSMAISKAHWHFLKTRVLNGKKRPQSTLSLIKHTGVYNKSIVYAYFIKKLKKFTQLY